ncbi:MAG: hypothetical protein COS97_00320 [Candidatus Nealsonbacteria bacterium CG07_land_8_20_14_0_80_40_10]|nr:MAG: hypothetical protein COU44_00360 [Candidatus Nealsonbacteria bacterium CG10_big_fil_rev_8_21_14_0_10_40_24]PIU43574.1 MAG: hypothetical protein COS97_00320 [Candidatus Nealsonbacteria bacterium CG07_land_8_20_14_0_80_40_10]
MPNFSEKMKKNSHWLIFIIAGTVLGFLFTQQFYLQKKIAGEVQPEGISDLAIQVLQLSKSNDGLKKEIAKLADEKQLSERSVFDRDTAASTLNKDIKKYQILTGDGAISGPGVEIKIERKMQLTQWVDLVNAIRNIGAEGIAVNSRRIIFNQGITDKDLSPPYTIDVVGNADLLYGSLSRRGGILDEIAQGQVTQKDLLILPSAQAGNR